MSHQKIGEPVPDSSSKLGQWAKLDDGSMSSRSKDEEHSQETLRNGNETFEMIPAVSTTTKKGDSPAMTRDLV